jgi:hypothetical protein
MCDRKSLPKFWYHFREVAPEPRTGSTASTPSDSPAYHTKRLAAPGYTVTLAQCAP